MTGRFTWKIQPTHTTMELFSSEAELKFALTRPSIQCVMRAGLIMMLQLSVTTLVTRTTIVSSAG